MRSILVFIVLMIISINLLSSNSNEWYNFDYKNSPGGLYSKVESIAVDNQNNIYFASFGGGVMFYNWEKWNGYNDLNCGISSNDIYQLSFDKHGNLWCATNLGVSKYDKENWYVWNRSNSNLSEDLVFSISIDSTDNVWAGTYFGLNQFVNSNWKRYYFDGMNLQSDINAIVTDNNNNIWIGLQWSGLLRYDQDKFYFIDEEKYEPKLYTYDGEYTVRAVAKDKLGNIWHSTDQGIAKRINDTTFLIYDMANSDIPSNYIYCLNVDNENNLWIGSDSGLSKFDGNNFITYNTSNSPIPSNFIKAIAIDSLGHKWISCRLPWLGESRISVFREGGTLFTTDVNDETDENNFIISPNPSFDNINVSYNLSTVSDIKITILNTLGNEVSELGKNNISPGFYTESINTLNLPSGTYFARIIVNNEVITRKINLIK